MKVNPNARLSKAAPLTPAKKATPTAASAPAQTDFTASAKLALKLAATPEARADQVARAKALVADPNYPDAKTVRAIARQLADKITPTSDSGSEA